jgi:hypothetical protein
MDTKATQFILDTINKSKDLTTVDNGELHQQAVERMGYDPIKEMRINKLEKMCSIMLHGKTVDGYYPISEEDKKFFFEIIKNIKPLMFKMVEGLANSQVDKETLGGELPIDIPFQTFSLEPADDWHSLYTVRDNNSMENMQMIVVHEESPTRLITFASYNKLRNDGSFEEYVKKSILTFTDDDKPSNVDSVYAPISIYLAKLNNRTANFKFTARTKCRFNGKKETIKIKANAIYIDPSKRCSDTQFFNQNIEWSHSWEVRGHWRSFKGTGKNRQGEKNVDGWTWVKPHKKGDGELLQKNRVVK